MPCSVSAAPARPMRLKSRASWGIEEVIIPPASGAASALGFLAAPLSFEQVRSYPLSLAAPGVAAEMEGGSHGIAGGYDGVAARCRRA